MLRRLRALQLLNVLMVASIVTPALIFGILAWLTHRAAFSDAEREIDWTSEVAREHAAKVFDTHRLVADRVNDLLKGMDDTTIRRSEQVIQATIIGIIQGLPQVQSIVVIDRDAHPLVATAAFPVATAEDFSDRDYFNALKQGKVETYISRVQNSRINGKSFFGWGRSRRGVDGAFDGVIDIAIAPSFFMQFYQTLISEIGDSTEGRIVAMVRDDGQILVRYPGFQGTSAVSVTNPFFEAVRKNPDGGIYTNRSVVDKGAPERIFAFRKVPGHPIYIVAGRSRTAITAEWGRDMLRYLGIGMPATVALFLVVLAARGGARREEGALAQLRTEMARRELAEDQLRQAQKMEAVGRLTGGIAHDFNNLLTGMTGGLDLIAKRIAQGRHAEVERYLTMARTSADRAAALTHRLLAFARRQPLDPKAVAVNMLVSSLEDLLRTTVGEMIDLNVVLTSGLWLTLSDPHQLENALINLTINARDAMPEGGRLTIETGNAHFDNASGGNESMAAGDYVRVSVSDTGVGMAPDVAARAFEPFFTTKPLGQGTGLGLSMIYGFARQSGGHAMIQSNPGEGTTVSLYLPRYAGEAATAKMLRDVSEPLPAEASETVLIVEDETAVRDLIAEVLGDLGYRILQAGDGLAGLRALQSIERIDLLITDVGLPGMNGRQMAKLGRDHRPDLKVLFITGYAEDATFGDGHFDPGMQMMAKPFALDALATRIRAMIDSD